MKKILLILLKIGISALILGYLVRGAWKNDLFSRLWSEPKNWAFLALAWCLCATAVTLTLIRWRYLVRALALPFPLKNALRLGFLGYLFNLAPLGIVGGDLLKAVMLAREHPGHRAQSIATVVLDRLIGLYMLFVVASAAMVWTGFWRLPSVELQTVCRVTMLAAAIGTVGVALLLIPAVTEGKLALSLTRLPRVGPHVESLIDAMRMYRRKPWVLVGAMLMSAAVHSLFATGVYFIGRGLPGNVLPYSMHLVILPLCAAGGVVPLPAGPFEIVLNVLYTSVGGLIGVGVVPGQGTIMGLGYRVITVLTATVGICYYLSSRHELTAVIHEAELEGGIDRSLVAAEHEPGMDGVEAVGLPAAPAAVGPEAARPEPNHAY